MGQRISWAAIATAVDIQEALTASDTAKKLSDAVEAAHKGSGAYAYYRDHIGDDESGDVIYSSNGDTYACPYEISANGDQAATASIDTEQKRHVSPRMMYEEEPDEADHYAAMQEAFRADKIYGDLPVYERFIAKAERDAADAESFAGKGKSFPILRPSDVMAAVRSMGRAGEGNYDTGTLKRKIIAIAKRKGWTKYLPKAWRGDGEGDGNPAKESAVQSGQSSALRLVESAAFPVAITIHEALAPGRKIKLIAPGKGSSAYYTAEALKKAVADKIFHAGTPMRIDHPTAAEEAARPEGSVKDWGAVLARDAEWLDDHKEGPGIYSEIKPFADHATFLAERAPYAAVSICANGSAVTEAGRPVMREGVPLLKEFVSAEGVDMVTRAGAGGMFLSEAARTANPREGGPDMDEATVKRLMEAAVAPFRDRAIRGDAREEASKILEGMSLHESAKALVLDSCMREIPQKDGDLDREKFRESVNAEAKRIGAAFAAATGSGRVTGMGGGSASETPDQIAAREAESKKRDDADLVVWESLLGNKAAAAFAAKGRAA